VRTPTPTPLPTPAPGALLFEADPAKGLTQFCFQHSVRPITVVTVGGRTAYRTEIRDGELIYGTERSELANGPGACAKHRFRSGDETWTLVPIYLDPAFPAMTSWGLVTQWKVPSGGSPPSQIAIDSGGFEILGVASESPRKQIRLMPAERGVWLNFLVHHKWSTDPAVGFVEVFVNGVQRMPRTFMRTMDNATDEMFLSVGMYRDTSNTGTAVVNIGKVRVGTTRAVVEGP